MAVSHEDSGVQAQRALQHRASHKSSSLGPEQPRTCCHVSAAEPPTPYASLVSRAVVKRRVEAERLFCPTSLNWAEGEGARNGTITVVDSAPRTLEIKRWSRCLKLFRILTQFVDRNVNEWRLLRVDRAVCVRCYHEFKRIRLEIKSLCSHSSGANSSRNCRDRPDLIRLLDSPACVSE
jgi:hypothetical protein